LFGRSCTEPTESQIVASQELDHQANIREVLMTSAVLVTLVLLLSLGNATEKPSQHVLVADPYYWSGPEGNLGIEISGKFQSEDGLTEVLSLSNMIGLFKDKKYPFKERGWRLRDILISVDFNGGGSIATWRVSGPEPLLLDYLDHLRTGYEDRTVFYDFSYRFVDFKPSTS
jgi:hypothetical protein